MTREELEHAIRAACDVVGDAELWVFGSQSILGQHPEAPEPVRLSMEVDVDPKNRPELVDRIDGALGEGSQFHQTHGFYVHGVSIETAVLPRGWKGRTKAVQNPNTGGATGFCLEAHDLAVSKLAAFREKDREFVRLLLREGLLNPNRLVRLINLLPRPDEQRAMLRQWVDGTERELALARVKRRSS
ncbi:MAG: hypothetical protein HY337_04070 [Gemmatimonadetes bacterium]|nr:hypothetical protein [Gemmatimonadota bacterium]